MGLELSKAMSSGEFDRVRSSVGFSASEMELLTKIVQLAGLIRAKGFSCEPYSQKSLEIFKSLDVSRQNAIRTYVENSLSVIEASTTWEPEIGDGAPSNRATIEQALRMYNLELRDDLWSVVEKDDIIEIYSENHIQIFRTFNFFKITGYSLLDLLTIEWFLLWKRPSSVITQLTVLAERAFSGSLCGVEPTGVSPHIVIEDYTDLTEDRPRSAKANFKYVCPLYKKDLPIRSGFAITCEGKLLEVGESNRSLSFI